MKKGDWGLSDVQFRLLIASLISLGQLVGYRDSEPVELTSYEALAQGEINRLKSGKSLAPDLIHYIDNNEAEADHDYLNRLRKLFVEQFDTLSRCFSYLSDPALRYVDQLPGTSESLKESKDILLIHLDEFFTSLEGFDSLK